MNSRRSLAALVCLAGLLVASCVAPTPTARPSGPKGSLSSAKTDLDVQSVVMNMGDDVATALAEAMNPVIADPSASPSARNFAQSFLRGGTSSAVDIAVSPNPDAALLDMLVLTSLGCWAFERQWQAAGIPEAAGQRAQERLRAGEQTVWNAAGTLLTPNQMGTLRAMIEDWEAANPTRVDIAFVRFSDFINLRDRAGTSNRVRATGLLREVTEASAVVDSARLLGERIVWYAGRYPVLVGQQVETTAYRLADQPELRRLMDAADSTKRLSDALTARVLTLEQDIAVQRDALFQKIASEREEAVLWAKSALEESAGIIVKDIDSKFASARDVAITQAFDRFAQERHAFLDDLEAREGTLRAMATELRDTIATTTTLATELTGTVGAIDRIVARFDQPAAPGSNRKPMEITDIRDAAIEATKAAERMTELLEQANQLTTSDRWDKGFVHFDRATSGVVDRAFWRGLILIAALVVGLALVRLVPQRVARPST